MLDDEKKQKLIERGKRLQILRGMLGLNITEFSKTFNLGISTVGQWEHGRLNGLSEKGARKVIAGIQQHDILCDLQWLLNGSGQPPQIINKDQPTTQLTYIPSNQEIFPNEASLIKHEINQFCRFLPDAMTMQVQDDAMEPQFQHGDYIGGQRLHDTDIKKAIGKNCIIQTADNRLFLRRLLKDETKDHYKLCSINPHTTVTEPIIWDIEIATAAPIIRLWRTSSNKE